MATSATADDEHPIPTVAMRVKPIECKRDFVLVVLRRVQRVVDVRAVVQCLFHAVCPNGWLKSTHLFPLIPYAGTRTGDEVARSDPDYYTV